MHHLRMPVMSYLDDLPNSYSFLLVCSRRLDERRKRRARELDDDAADRRREEELLHELGKQAKIDKHQSPRGTPGEGKSAERVEGVKAEEGVDAAEAAVKHEFNAAPDIDSNDPIYQAMMTAAKVPSAAVKQEVKPEHDAASCMPHPDHTAAHHPGWGQQQHTVGGSSSAAPDSYNHPPAAAPAAPAVVARVGVGAKRKPAAVSALFGEEEEEGSQRRKLVPIQYTEEELRAVQEVSKGRRESDAKMSEVVGSAVHKQVSAVWSWDGVAAWGSPSRFNVCVLQPLDKLY